MEYLFCIFAYLLGSVPFGLIIGRLVKGIDVREHGSGNLGATNVFRVIGRRWGIFVLFLDALKGYLAVALPNAILMGDISPLTLILLALAAIAGHAFPVWLKFKGGKGVATALGVFLALAFKPTLITFIAFSWRPFKYFIPKNYQQSRHGNHNHYYCHNQKYRPNPRSNGNTDQNCG